MDFFEANGLSIDAKNRELFTRGSGATICQVTTSDDGPEDVHVQPSPEMMAEVDEQSKPVPTDERDLFDLLDSFPAILSPNFHLKNNKHHFEHYVKTNGHPVFAKPRRLDQAKLEAAKAEFAELECLGIIRRSDSPWSSPLHVMPKANGKLRPCGDYRCHNEMTVPDKYPLRHIHDFNERLLGATVFSKVE